MKERESSVKLKKYLYKSYELYRNGFIFFKEKGFVIFLTRLLNFLYRQIFIRKLNVGLRFNLKDIFSELQVNNEHWISAHRDQFKGKKKFLLTDCNIRPNKLKDIEVLRTTQNLSNEVVRNSFFYIYFICDSDALPELRRIVSCGGVFYPHLNASKTHYRFINRQALNAILSTHKKIERLPHYPNIIHENICEALELTKNLDGDFVEIGVYKGVSALTALNYLCDLRDEKNNKVNRKAWLLDTFDGFNYDESYKSSDVMWAETHKLFGVKETMNYIRETFSDISVDFELVQSNICTDMLPSAIKKIVVANIDVDMLEATRDSLLKISPLMVKGGIIVCEDPASTPACYGAFLAMEDFLASKEGKNYIKIFKHGQYFLIRL
jgi:hypothetical protein